MNYYSLPFLSLLSLAILSFAFGQPEEVLQFPSNNFIHHHRFDQKLIILNSGRIGNQVHLIHLETATIDTLNTGINDVANVQFGSQGAFFTHFVYDGTGNSGSYYLQYVDIESREILSLVIGEPSPQGTPKYSPKYATLCQEKYYITGYKNGVHNVWESDGTTEGTQVIFQSQSDILALSSVKDQLLVISQNTANYQFWRYEPENGSLHLFAEFNKDLYENTELGYPDGVRRLGISGNDGDHLYFNLNASNDSKAVWETDLTSSGTRIFLEDWNISQLTFTGDQFYFNANTPSVPRYFIGFKDVPQLLDTLHFAEEYATPSQKVLLELAPNLFRVGSYEFGIELAYLDEQGELRLFDDFAKGGSSSVPCDAFRGTSCYSTDNFILTENRDLISVLSNGKDPHFYLYRTNETTFESLFQVEDPYNFHHPFAEGEDLYWFETNGMNLALKKFKMDAGFRQTQTGEDKDPNIWLRQVSTAYLGIPFQLWQSNHRVRPKGVAFGSDGSVFAGFWDRGWIGGGKGIYTSDTTIHHPNKGSDLFVKYDAKGNILWQNSFGTGGGTSGFSNSFAVDREDNIVVFGTFFKNAYFDEDTIRTNRAGHYLYKIDGESGELLWRQLLAFTYYSNDMEVGRNLAFDHNNNIYLSFYYRNFQLNFANQALSSIYSLQNAYASFEPGGNLRWVNNLDTPWSNQRFGMTRALTFNEEDQHLYVAQSQGFFNVSSSCNYRDWMYFLQTFNTEGEVVDTMRFGSGDLGGLVAGDINSKGRFVGVGYHRGQLEMGRFRSQAPPSEDCTSPIGFIFEYEANKSKFTLGGSLNDQEFMPLDLKAYEGYQYLLGTIANRLTLLKYTDEGTFVGIKRLQQRTDPDNFGYYRYLDVKDGYIAVVFTQMSYNRELEIAPLLVNESVISILTLKDEDWKQEETETFSIVQDLAEDEELILFPNPFQDYIRLHLSEAAAGSTHFDLYTIHGQQITQGELNGARLQELSLPDLVRGTYIFRLTGGAETYTQKIVKN